MSMGKAGEVDQLKKWALRKFREALRGVRITEGITRVSDGEMPNYRFTIDMNVDEAALKYVQNSLNNEKLAEETL